MDGRGASRGYAVFTILALAGLIAVVALLINSYDTDVDAVSSPVAASAPSASEPALPQTAIAPVGGVATGGGGTAVDGSGGMGVAVVAGVAALALVTTAGMRFRQREATTPV